MTRKQRIIADIRNEMDKGSDTIHTREFGRNEGLSLAVYIVERIMSEPVTEEEIEIMFLAYADATGWGIVNSHQEHEIRNGTKAALHSFIGGTPDV